MKSPPDRPGISFEVGAQLEARDSHKNWYTASIEKIDYEKEQVLVHYRQWSRRHDEWFPWSSPYLRPLERISLRREGLNQPRPRPLFTAGTKVLACWTDCRLYPAKVIKVNKDDSYKVRFYDGVVQTVKPNKVKPYKEKVGSKFEDSTVETGDEEDEGESETTGAEEKDRTQEKQEKTVTSSTNTTAKRKAEDKRSHDLNDQSNGTPEQPIGTDSAQPVSPAAVHAEKDVLLERQAHLPTTHKYSREPLYRVIKNQPPPILSIELDHNPFKCPAPGCTKSFRKGSLLHYHIKYYHSDQQLLEPGSDQRSQQKQLSTEGRDFLSERRKENQDNNTCHRDNRESVTVETGGVKDEGKREKKNFLRIKLKKRSRRKRRSHSENCSSEDEMMDRPPLKLRLPSRLYNPHIHDDGSDWSTATAESEDDRSPWSVGMETEGCEAVRCVCEVEEEHSFMIQCELCQCWQHGACMGLYEDNIPDNYHCYYCRNSHGWRQERFLPDPDWLTSGHMFGLSCVKENYSELNAAKVSHTHNLLAHTHGLSQVLRGLQLKISLLRSPSHPDLQLWKLPWQQEEEELLVPANQRGEAGVSSACYVSSEHCYQKPKASLDRCDDQTQTDGTNQNQDQNQDPNISLNSEHMELKPQDRVDNTQNIKETHMDKHTDTEAHACRHTTKHTHPDTSRQTDTVMECQLNLLGHIESVHSQITLRMDLIERELDVLESWLDHSGELEPPDPLSRLPQLKQRIRGLLCDLDTVRLLSICH